MATSNNKGIDPIEQGLNNTPKPLPKGIPFSDRVEIWEIPYSVSCGIYENHHSYVNAGREQSFIRHGIYFDDELVGAIDWAYMLCSSPIGYVPSHQYVELARVCVAVDMPNLASCAVAKSQKKASETFDDKNIRLLVSYVREDYDGTMFKALDGWERDGHISTGHQAGNRPDRDIRDWDKVRWVYTRMPFFSSFRHI